MSVHICTQRNVPRPINLPVHRMLQRLQNLGAVQFQNHQLVRKRQQCDQIVHGDVACRQRRTDTAALHKRHRSIRPERALVVPGPLVHHRVSNEVAHVALVQAARTVHDDARLCDKLGLHRLDVSAIPVQDFQDLRVARHQVVEQQRRAVEFGQLAGGVKLCVGTKLNIFDKIVFVLDFSKLHIYIGEFFGPIFLYTTI